jgi:hypothetical protein
LMATVRLYTQIPDGQEALYARAVEVAWQAFCAGREATDG